MPQRVMKTYKNPTMRGMGSTHGVSVNRLHELFQGDCNLITSEETTHLV